MSANPQTRRVVSGMRPTGRLHLGNLHGVLKSWVDLQYQYECYFFVADWHALATDYQRTESVPGHVREMVIDWLAAGVNPGVATLFVQSHVPEHAELHLLLSMILPLDRLSPQSSDNSADAVVAPMTYGRLGYAVLQAADILAYRPEFASVGEDQVGHIDLARELARRFNDLYGREPDFEAKAEKAVKGLGGRNTTSYRQLRKRYQETRDAAVLERARALVQGNARLTVADRERLLGYLEGSTVTILPEPQAHRAETPQIPGIDGRKMSKSLGNAIGLREDPDAVAAKLRAMAVDPQRDPAGSPGDPARCPTWALHRVYSDGATQAKSAAGCRSGSLPCADCKAPLVERVVEEVVAMRRRAQEYEDNPDLVRTIVAEGAEKAREAARETLDDVRRAMHLRE